jgi:hypothetical protein
VLASSLPRETRSGLDALTTTRGVTPVSLRGEEYVMVSRPFARAGTAADPNGPTTLILRSRTERLRYLSTLRAGLGGALIVTLLLATVLSYAVARTMTRPLAAVTDAMRDVAATGDLTRKVTVQSRAWDDEDARLLGSTFNTLTESIARFQREAAQRERLSSLGRLSHRDRPRSAQSADDHPRVAVVAAGRARVGARRARGGRGHRRGDAADQPHRHRGAGLRQADPLRLRRDERQRRVPRVGHRRLGRRRSRRRPPRSGPDIPPFVTDAERLRTVLVNSCQRAASRTGGGRRSDARRGHGSRRAGRHPAHRTARLARRHLGGRPRAGISPEDLPHVFDPYYTTRRSGTGLGLPIAKNIVEGLVAPSR